MTTFEYWFILLTALGYGILIGLFLGTILAVRRLQTKGRLAGYVAATGRWHCPTCDKYYTEEEYYNCEHAKSWEDAAKSALETTSKTLEDLRVAEVVKQDVVVENGKISAFRVRLNISFKYHGEK